MPLEISLLVSLLLRNPEMGAEANAYEKLHEIGIYDVHFECFLNERGNVYTCVSNVGDYYVRVQCPSDVARYECFYPFVMQSTLGS